MSVSVSPLTHSSTTYAWPPPSSTSKTCAILGSVSLLAARAAVTTCETRGKPDANVSTDTGRASVSSMAFHMVQPFPAVTWSTSR